MRRSLLLTAVLVLACAKSGATPSDSATAAPEDKATVQAAIDSALNRFVAAVKAGDTAAMISIYAPDAIVLPANMPEAKGHAAIQKMNAEMLAAVTLQDIRFRTTDLLLTGPYAIETGTYDMKVQPKAGGSAVADVGKYLSVWQKQSDGSWKMIRDIYNSDKPAAPAH
jgi:uncharacterized protein (TIGR02246 family)